MITGLLEVRRSIKRVKTPKLRPTSVVNLFKIVLDPNRKFLFACFVSKPGLPVTSYSQNE